MAGVDNKDGGYICRHCGRKAVPLDFVSQSELRAFKEDTMEPEPSKSFMHVPIMPVDTRSLLSLAGVDIPLGNVAEVVSVKWDGERLVRTEYNAKFSKYWKAVSGQRYNASEVMLMDLAGITEAHPNFEVLRQLLKRKYNVWLEIGMRNEDDLFDAFAMGVSYAIAGSLAAGASTCSRNCSSSPTNASLACTWTMALCGKDRGPDPRTWARRSKH